MPLWKMGLLFLPFISRLAAFFCGKLGARRPLMVPESTRDDDTWMSPLLSGICDPVGKMTTLDFLGFE